MNVTTIAAAFGKKCDGKYYSEYIEKWHSIYENTPEWHDVKKGGLYNQNSKRELLRLNMAKVLCEGLSAMTFSEQCEININNEAYQEYVKNALNSNGFWKNMPVFLCSAYALGGGALKAYLQENKVRIDYVIADKFIPVKWDGNGISEGIFASTTIIENRYYTLAEYQTPGRTEIKLFRSQSEKEPGQEVPLLELYPDLPSVSNYEAEIPMFAYFRPFVSNNADYDTPLGMSVFADCIDTLNALDTVFDSFHREFILGKKRIIVPSGCIRPVLDVESQEMKRYFDTSDEVFVALDTDDMNNLKIADNTAELRIEEHTAAINAYLNILCMQTGLSAGTFSFDVQQGMKTATEIISQESKSARTVKNNKNLLTETIEGIIHAVIALGVYSKQITKADYELSVSWQDNVVIDDNTLIDNNIKLVSGGLKSKLRAIMDVLKCTEEEAKAELKRIADESNVSGMEIDLFGGSGNDDPGQP